MIYIIFRLLCNFFDLCCINLCKAAKHWDSFLSDCNGLKSELFAFHLPFFRLISRSIYIVPCDREIWVPQIRCSCIECERDLAGNILNHNVNKEWNIAIYYSVDMMYAYFFTNLLLCNLSSAKNLCSLSWVQTDALDDWIDVGQTESLDTVLASQGREWRVILAQGPCESWLNGTDFKKVAFSTKVQQARCTNREAKTKKWKGKGWKL